MKILVVDDEKLIASSLCRVLKLSGHETFVANSGIEALKAFDSGPFHIVFLDFLMPDINGDEILKKIKEKWGSQTTVVMMTAYGDQQSLNLKKKGADLVLSKPFDDITKIPELISKLVKN